MSSRAVRYTAVVLWLLLLVGLWHWQGPRLDKEALKYTGCAEQVLRGDFHDLFGSYAKYGAYVLFLLPFVALGAPMAAIAAQALLAFFSAQALAELTTRVGGVKRAADAAFVLALLCLPLQQWVLALYTESFFISTAVLFLERVTRDGKPDPPTWLLALVTLFARPVGLLFVLPALWWKWSTGRVSEAWSRTLPYVAMLLLAVVIPGIPPDQMRPVVEGDVVCGFPEHPGAMEGFDGSCIAAAQAYLVEQHGLLGAFALAIRRGASLFTLPRPYYSRGHNLVLALHYVLIASALLGWWSSRGRPVTRLLQAIVLLNVLLVALTHDEWSGRFLVPFWPVIALFAGLFVSCTIERLRRHG